MSEKKWVRISTKKLSNRLKELGYHVALPQYLGYSKIWVIQ